MKLRAIVTAMVIALTTPALADISDYEAMHRRLADVLGSRAQADAAYDRLMKEADTYGQAIELGGGSVHRTLYSKRRM